MALRQEDVYAPTSVVLRFPTGTVRMRARRQTIIRRLGLACLAILVVALLMLAAGPGGSAVASRRGSPEAVVVAPGETLWDIAQRYAPSTVDPRAYVDALVEINGIEGAVQAGEHLELPG